jgi:hypothetical protein
MSFRTSHAVGRVNGTIREMTQLPSGDHYYVKYLLTPCSTLLLKELTGFQLVKKFPAFYETRRFITAFTSSRHLSLSWAKSIQTIPPHPTSWKSNLIVSSHLDLGLPSGHFPSDFPNKHLLGARGSAVGWGTALQVGRSWVRFPMVSMEFFIYIISPAALWPWGWLSL